ncbi:hypothetical protein SAMN05660841_04094 [Sphingobacterium nematocida]|uniref:Uncharacterized protein n=1 Tax=Sphingobacterium nematocida TaxID=1513896 RepID=A0A1T5GI85_9SPHI|nr:hypothetical protein [Sphingobacterium nematocida]SKC08095.1 hypothetical protein SAMN05660841_04094 [Sphingobacterium nematocida]
MNNFFYRNWWLYYLAFFLLLGALVYALLWKPIQNVQIKALTKQLEDCRQATAIAQKALPPKIVNCDARVNSGGPGYTRTKHMLGSTSGTVILQYHTQVVPDEVKLIYEDKVVATTGGLVSGPGQLSWNYIADTNKPNYCYVEVTAPHDNTIWEYIVNCPN